MVLCGGCQTGGQRVESFLAGYRATPTSSSQSTSQLEKQFGGICHDPEAAIRLERVGWRIIGAITDSGVKYNFALLSSHEPNALSLSGGNVYVTSGLYRLLTSDDLLAGVLAHELAHIVNGDSLKPNNRAGAQLTKELAADHTAVCYLAAAGYNPRAFIDLLRLLEEQQVLCWGERRITTLSKQLDSGTTLSPGISRSR